MSGPAWGLVTAEQLPDDTRRYIAAQSASVSCPHPERLPQLLQLPDGQAWCTACADVIGWQARVAERSRVCAVCGSRDRVIVAVITWPAEVSVFIAVCARHSPAAPLSERCQTPTEEQP